MRICVNISPGTLETTSTLSDGRTPRASILPVGGGPCPISISTYGAIDALPPVSAIQSSSSSVEVGHVDVADVGPHQPEVVHVLHGCVVQGVEAHADVDADEDPELARERPVVLRDVGVHVAGLARGHRERDQAVVGREVRVADAADVLGVVRSLNDHHSPPVGMPCA